MAALLFRFTIIIIMRCKYIQQCRRILVMSGFGNIEMSCLNAHPAVEAILVEHWSTNIAKRGISGHDDRRVGPHQSH